MSHVACVLALALLPVVVQAEEPGAEALEDLSTREAQWDARGIDSYRFKVWFAGAAGRLGPAEISVAGGKIVSAHYINWSSEHGSWEPGSEVEADSKLRKTVPQLFAVATEAVKSGFRWRLGSKEPYEFPDEIAGHSANGDDFIYKVYDFVVTQ
jgi:Family of unknown function (DUF6174)